MKTYYVAVTKEKYGLDFVIFDYVWNLVDFAENKPTYNFLDDSVRLHAESGSKIKSIRCFLASSIVDASNKAWNFLNQLRAEA